jgi:hypothetical protein
MAREGAFDGTPFHSVQMLRFFLTAWAGGRAPTHACRSSAPHVATGSAVRGDSKHRAADDGDADRKGHCLLERGIDPIDLIVSADPELLEHALLNLLLNAVDAVAKTPTARVKTSDRVACADLSY